MSSAASEFTEIEIEVAADLVRSCPGLSLDVGGSVAKIVYRSKKDWEELVNNKDAKTGKLRLLSCARTLLDEAIAKVKVEAHITRSGSQPTEIFTCGVGCSQFGARINRQLGIKLTNVLEMDCFIKAFVYLTERYTPQDLLKPPMKEAEEIVDKQFEQARKDIEKWKAMTNMELSVSEKNDEENSPGAVDIMTSDQPLSKAIGDFYPSMMAMLGSAFGFMAIKSDGSFSIPDGSNRGGRTLLGLGSLLTQAKTYNEIIDLAEKGNRFKVDTSTSGFGKETAPVEGEEHGTDVYADLFDGNETQEQVVFAFGNAVGKTIADFNREDLASAIVHLSIMDTVQTIHKTALDAGTKHVFICGSYAARDYMRKLFTIEWLRRNLGSELMGTKSIEELPKLYFMTAGSHLGALGALINNIEGFIGKDGKVANKSEDNSNNSNTNVEASGPTKM